MKFWVKIFTILLIVVTVVTPVRNKLEKALSPVLDPVVEDAKHLLFALKDKISGTAPCEKPITYDIGTFDTKFGISEEYFLSALASAEKIWEEPYGKELFEHKEGGELKINLVYDYRQEATAKLKALGLDVEETKVSYDKIKAKYNSLKAEYNTVTKEYDARIKIFEERRKAYEAEVEKWNSKGGAPQGEYEKLQAEGKALQAESIQLQKMQAEINELVANINSLVVVLNRLADVLNITVREYNEVSTERGESFEEGVYHSDANGEYIEIYEFSDKNKLIRVLAHELGHALGLEHTEDTKAIMYKLNQGSNLSLTEGDMKLLEAKCGAK